MTRTYHHPETCPQCGAKPTGENAEHEMTYACGRGTPFVTRGHCPAQDEDDDLAIIELDPYGKFSTETYPTECHFCKKTYDSCLDFSKSQKNMVDGLYACCDECMTVKPCTVDDHKLWTMTLECGSVSFECEDKCSVEDASRMRDWGSVCRGPGGDWQEYAFAEFPVTIKFDRGSPDWETGVYDDFSFDVTLREEAK